MQEDTETTIVINEIEETGEIEIEIIKEPIKKKVLIKHLKL